jgi:outer membrane protein assembly factor BamA
MPRLLLRFVLPVALLSIAHTSVAQEPGSRAEEEARAQEEKARTLNTYQPTWIEQRLLSIENAGGFGVARGFVVKFGDIKRGSGFAPGVGYGYTTADGAVLAGKGVYSIKNYKLLQLSAQSPHLAGDRVLFRARARWQDVPKAPLYPLGTNPPVFRTDYVETKTELSAEALATPVRFLRFGGGLGIEWFETSFSHDQNPVGLPLFESLPGAGADPRYFHTRASAAFDVRDSPGFSRHGTLLSGTLHDYRDAGGTLSFQRFDGTAEQYVPILHGNWVIYLGLWASTTMTSDGSSVPFFLMPDLGGHDLRAFSDYRFRDRHSINWTAEYRWYAQEFLEAAIFYDAGKTVSTRSALDFNGMHGSIGAGLRLHTATATLMRVELAHSEEGLRFLIGFSPVGK